MSDAALARAHGGPVLRACIRSQPEDFIVEELDAFAPSGSGEHLLLRVEKRGMNTAYAAGRIAAWAGVPDVAIGYAGLKDRHAVTRQRFTVHLPKKVAPALESLDGPGLRVLEAHWHARKLPRGALAGNRFVLALRDVQGDRGAIDERLQAIARCGVPNYYGEQRFGRDAGNVEAALAMFAGRRVDRAKRSILLSAARSALFNQVLSRRVADGTWNAALPGEVWILDGSRSVFGPEPFDDVLGARLAAFDIHPSAPLWGRGELRTREAAQELENAVLEGGHAPALRRGLEAAGLRQERRATRLPVRALEWTWPGDGTLVLCFELDAGSYATSVLDELGPCQAETSA